MIETTRPSVTGQSRCLYRSNPIDIMNSPSIPDDWPTKRHLDAYLDQMTAGDVIDVVVAGNRVQIGDDGSGSTARCDGRTYPVMVDDETFDLLSDEAA